MCFVCILNACFKFYMAVCVCEYGKEQQYATFVSIFFPNYTCTRGVKLRHGKRKKNEEKKIDNNEKGEIAKRKAGKETRHSYLLHFNECL